VITDTDSTPVSWAQLQERLPFELNDECSLVDVLRCREQGVSLQKAAEAFQIGLEYFEATGQSLYRRNLLGASEPIAKVRYPREGIDREMIILASNNYLCLNTHPKVVAAAIAAAQHYGIGTCSAPLLIGTLPLTNELEQKLARFKGAQEGLLFPTGYSANLGVISALCGKNDVVIVDRLSHASIIDGARLSHAKVKVFRHNDADHLDKILARTHTTGIKFVVVEGIYSMDGDIAPLDKLVEVSKRHGAMIMVDEAHATGVLGPGGRGTVAHFGLDGQVDLQLGTMSKSLGATGGFVCGRKEIINYIRYFARSCMFSAAPSPMVLAGVSAALDVIEAEPQLREQLWVNSRFLFDELKLKGFTVGPDCTPIIPVIVGSMKALRQMTLELHEKNICVNSIPFPAVPHGSERLRLSVTAKHTLPQLQHVVECVEAAGRNAGVIQ